MKNTISRTHVITPRIVLGIILLIAPLSPRSASACTAFQLTAADGAHIYFRSMEFGFAFDSQVLIVPRGTDYTGTAAVGKPGLKWQAKHGVVGLNANIMRNMVADGMNEKGLALGMLYLPGYSQYLPPDEARTSQTIGSWEVGIFVLSTCATVEEAVDALTNRVYVAQQEFAPFKRVLPVHYWIGDTNGMS